VRHPVFPSAREQGNVPTIPGASNMGSGWYYAHDETKIGPFSGDQLKDLAASGELLPLDTVWKGGVEQGVQASRVKNLFAAAPAVMLATDNSSTAALVSAPTPEAPRNSPTTPAKTVNRGRAVALRSADIVSQDGTQAKYRKKCTACGTVDSSCHTITISNKTTKANYFCPKCRKRREVVIQCTTR
jgi:GYF domain 2